MKSSRPRVAFVAPRLPKRGAVGGAETLVYALARLAASSGMDTEFLTTTAKNHFTWENELAEGEERDGALLVRKFRVDEERSHSRFMELQRRICDGDALSGDEEEEWLRNSVNSRSLCLHIAKGGFDHIVAGPYLFGLTLSVARLFPEKTFMVPCLHDEPFARVGAVAEAFRSVKGHFFNTTPEMDLAVSLYGLDNRPGRLGVVGFPLDDFGSCAARGRALAGTGEPYLLFCGRREPMKGTPLLLDYWAAYRATHPESGIKFVFTGSGEIDRPHGLEGEIVDLGFVSEEDKHDIMAGALAFCHASLNESLGIVLLESWLARRPVLVHAMGRVLADQTARASGGLWFRDFAEFSEDVDFLLGNPGAAEALALSGRRFVLENYSSAAVSKRLADRLA